MTDEEDRMWRSEAGDDGSPSVSARKHRPSEQCQNKQPWYTHKKFRRYWHHHHQVWQWYQCHLVAKYNSNIYSPTFGSSWGRGDQYGAYYKQWHTWWQNWYHNIHRQCQPSRARPRPSGSSCNAGNGDWSEVSNMSPETSSTSMNQNKPKTSKPKMSKSRKRSRRRKKSQARQRKRSRVEVSMMGGGQQGCRTFEMEMSGGSDDESCMEMEITDEMLEFFAQSAQHRKQRDATRLEEEGEEKEKDFTATGEEVTRSTVLPPGEQRGVKRTVQMKQLYGRGAAMIHGMETAMQLNYDRNCDIKQPKLWPNIPLSIKFDDR